MGNCFLYKRGFGGGFGGGGGEITPEVEKTASGKGISILDSMEKPLKGLRLFGKTTQNGTPSPTAPVPLVSAGDGGSIIVTIGTSESDTNPQTLTVSTPNGLPGIHVSEGGNYTDENGWQWICDEVDFAKGVYVQRVLQNVFNGSENWKDRTEEFTQKQDGQYRFSLNNPFSVKYGKLDERVESTYGLSDWGSVKGLHGVANKSADGFTLYTASQALYIGYITTSQYTSLEELKYGLSNNPLTVLAILETPIETALSAEQLAAYAALHTYSPSTTIFNDADSYMEVKYIAKGG